MIYTDIITLMENELQKYGDMAADSDVVNAHLTEKEVRELRDLEEAVSALKEHVDGSR